MERERERRREKIGRNTHRPRIYYGGKVSGRWQRHMGPRVSLASDMHEGHALGEGAFGIEGLWAQWP
jgi:hypothetical protein